MGLGPERRDDCDSEGGDKRVRSGCVRTVRYTATFIPGRNSTNDLFYRLVSVARGEQDYFSPEGIPTAVEGCKSTALRRCCKDLGVASELWDPKYIRKFMAQHVKEVYAENQITKKRKKLYLRKDDVMKYPYKEIKYGNS